MNQPKNRPVLGRTLESPLAGGATATAELSHRFTLASGRKVSFVTIIIPAEEVATYTYVNESVNGRLQSALTPESLEDITRTLPYQQFFPVIGHLVGDRIEILDGSRRRAGALICGVELRVMYTKSELSHSEARQLSADIQTAKEHNIREIGKRLLTLKEEGFTQKEIAEMERMSQAKVTRAMQAAAVPDALLSVFPVLSELAYPDYKKLLVIAELADKKEIPLDKLVDTIKHSAEALRAGAPLSHDDYKNEIIKLFDKALVDIIAKPATVKPVIESLKKYEDSRMYARKKSDIKDRKVIYEFCRISKEAQDKIDEAIRAIIEQYE